MGTKGVNQCGELTDKVADNSGKEICMKMFEIGKVADTVVEMTGLMECDIKYAWKHYMHDAVKEGYTLKEVEEYISKKTYQGE